MAGSLTFQNTLKIVKIKSSEHIEFCTHKFINIRRKNRHIFNTTTISGRKPNITGVLLCLSELISNLHIYPTEINNISNAIILSIAYSVLQHLQSGRNRKNQNLSSTGFYPHHHRTSCFLRRNAKNPLNINTLKRISSRPVTYIFDV